MPNRLKLLRQRGPRIFDKLSRAKGPIAFLDESFLTPSQGDDSFYILCAVVVDKSEVGQLRRGLAQLAGSTTWHTSQAGRTEVGRQKIRQLARLIAESSLSVIAVVEELEPEDAKGEFARADATQKLLSALAENYIYQTGTVIYEKRVPGEMRARDEAVLKKIAQGNSPASKLNIWGLAAKDEPLLWAPDLVAWCFRQAYFEKDDSFFQDLEKTTTRISL